MHDSKQHLSDEVLKFKKYSFFLSLGGINLILGGAGNEIEKSEAPLRS